MLRVLLILSITLMSSTHLMAQEFNYNPKNENNVDDMSFNLAKTILEETSLQVNENNGKLNYANLWNIAVAYNLLGKTADEIIPILERSKKKNPYSFSLIFTEPMNIKEKWLRCFTNEEYDRWYIEAQNTVAKHKALAEKTKKPFNANQKYDPELIKAITEIKLADSKFRDAGDINMDKQRLIDNENMVKIDALHDKYNCYIGKSMVGKDLSYVMWSVIQHSNLTFMEKYLPVVNKAILDKELDKNVIKMLVDRIYTIKHDKQIFGSQLGVEIATDTEALALKEKYSYKPSNVAKTKKRKKQSFDAWFNQD
ncbi:DUF6624 domain-containing protein [uncultured Psychroserpens sp.]|uniref:DUF6624 domain-containing protein n=1 Tax=uncultured Psychroserpens sp. TaxID=255436 RepID=UPI0026266016|nr:DUF6624 domain-containing protein [uncultured Psychroserpens sp.]